MASSLGAYVQRKNPMLAGISANQPGQIPDLDPKKVPLPTQPAGYNAQSAANQQGGLLAPPAPPPAAAAAPAAPKYPQAMNESTAPRPAIAPATTLPPPGPPPTPAPTQPNAPVGGYTQGASGTWGPAQGPQAILPPAPAAPAGGGAVSTRHANAAPSTAAQANQTNMPAYTPAQMAAFTQLANNPSTPEYQRAQLNALIAANPPGTLHAVTPEIAQTPTSSPNAPLMAQNAGVGNGMGVYNDPLMQSLLKETQGRINGQTTTAEQLMNQRTQQQANASQGDIDRRLAGRGLGSNNPLRDKLYSDVQQNVNDQMALRDAQLNQQALDQGVALKNAATGAQSAQAFQQEVANQAAQFQENLNQQKSQQGVNNISSLLSGLAGGVTGAPAMISGLDALRKYLGIGGTASNSPTQTELGFRLPQPASSPFGGF